MKVQGKLTCMLVAAGMLVAGGVFAVDAKADAKKDVKKDAKGADAKKDAKPTINEAFAAAKKAFPVLARKVEDIKKQSRQADVATNPYQRQQLKQRIGTTILAFQKQCDRESDKADKALKKAEDALAKAENDLTDATAKAAEKAAAAPAPADGTAAKPDPVLEGLKKNIEKQKKNIEEINTDIDGLRLLEGEVDLMSKRR